MRTTGETKLLDSRHVALRLYWLILNTAKIGMRGYRLHACVLKKSSWIRFLSKRKKKKRKKLWSTKTKPYVRSNIDWLKKLKTRFLSVSGRVSKGTTKRGEREKKGGCKFDLVCSFEIVSLRGKTVRILVITERFERADEKKVATFWEEIRLIFTFMTCMS